MWLVSDLEKTKKIKDFTKRCLLNGGQQEMREKVISYLSQSYSFEEFVSFVLNDLSLRKYQGYWELAKDTGFKNVRSLAIAYLFDLKKQEELQIAHITSMSDIGAVKVGNSNFAVNISNKYGDTYNNDIFIIESEKGQNLNFDFAKFETEIIGTDMNIYDYDCGNTIQYKLKNERYGVFAYERLLIFQKWS